METMVLNKGAECIVVRDTGSNARVSGFKSGAVRQWISYLTSLCINFLIFKTEGIIIVLHLMGLL